MEIMPFKRSELIIARTGKVELNCEIGIRDQFHCVSVL